VYCILRQTGAVVDIYLGMIIDFIRSPLAAITLGRSLQVNFGFDVNLKLPFISTQIGKH
jgi:hypothetical protein